jgi:hypothetical protein
MRRFNSPFSAVIIPSDQPVGKGLARFGRAERTPRFPQADSSHSTVAPAAFYMAEGEAEYLGLFPFSASIATL